MATTLDVDMTYQKLAVAMQLLTLAHSIINDSHEEFLYLTAEEFKNGNEVFIKRGLKKLEYLERDLKLLIEQNKISRKEFEYLEDKQ